MTSKKQAPDQEPGTAKERGVWLARVPTGADAENGSAAGDSHFEAHRTARRAGAAVVAEFFWSADEDTALSGAGWRELLEFVRHVRATVLVVLGPQEIAYGFEDYYRRRMDLEEDGVRLVFPEGIGLRRPPRSSVERSAA